MPRGCRKDSTAGMLKLCEQAKNGVPDALIQQLKILPLKEAANVVLQSLLSQRVHSEWLPGDHLELRRYARLYCQYWRLLDDMEACEPQEFETLPASMKSLADQMNQIAIRLNLFEQGRHRGDTRRDAEIVSTIQAVGGDGLI